MKKMKKIVASILVVCLMASLLPLAALAEEPEETPDTISAISYNEAYVRLLLEQDGEEPLTLSPDSSYPVPAGSFTVTAEFTEAGLRDRYPFYSNAILVFIPEAAPELAFAAYDNAEEGVLGSYTFAAGEAAGGIQIYITEHNTPVANEFKLHYSQEYGENVCVNGEELPNDSFSGFAAGDTVRFSFPDGMTPYKITAETGFFSGVSAADVPADGSGQYSYTFGSAAGTTFQIYWSENEYAFEKKESYVQEGYTLYDLLLAGAGKKGTAVPVGLTEGKDYYVIGSRFNRTAIAFANDITSITMQVIPEKNYSFNKAFAGDLTITELDENGCFTFEATASSPRITVYFDYIPPAEFNIFTYWEDCYTVTLGDSEVYTGAFFPDAGQTLHAGLTEEGEEYGYTLKGVALHMYDTDRTIRYIPAVNNTVNYTITEEDLAVGFGVTLICNSDVFAGEFRVNYDGATYEFMDGLKVWLLTESGRLFLPGNEVCGLPGDELSLLIESDGLYAVELEYPNTASELIPASDKAFTDNGDGTKTLTVPLKGNMPLVINVYESELAYGYDHPGEYHDTINEFLAYIYAEPDQGEYSVQTNGSSRLIGARCERSLYAVSKEVTELVFHIASYPGYTDGSVWFNGNFYMPDENGSVTVTVPVPEGPDDLYFRISFTCLPSSIVYGYSESLYTLTVDGEPLCSNEEFTAKAGQVIRAELTDEGKSLRAFLKGFVLYLNDHARSTCYVFEENGIAEHTVTAGEAEATFSLQLVDWDLAFPGEFYLDYDGAHVPEEIGTKVWLATDGDPEFLAGWETYLLPAGGVKLLIDAESLYDVELEWGGLGAPVILKPGDEGLTYNGYGSYELTVSKDHDSPLTVRLHQTLDEHKYEHSEEYYDFEKDLVLYIETFGSGTAAADPAEGVTYIGRSGHNWLYAVNRSVKTVTLSLTPYEDYALDCVTVDGTDYFPDENGRVTIDMPSSEWIDYVNAYVNFSRVPCGWVWYYDTPYYFLTVDGAPLSPDSDFTLKAGQVIRAGLTAEGKAENRFLRGLILYHYDEAGTVRYIRAADGAAEYTLSAKDAASPFDLELVEWDRPFDDEFCLTYDGAEGPEEDGMKVWRAAETPEYLENSAAYSFGGKDLTLLIQAESLYRICINRDGAFEPLSLEPGDEGLSQGEDGIWRLTVAASPDRATFIDIYQTEAEYLFSQSEYEYDPDTEALMEVTIGGGCGSVELVSDENCRFVGSRFGRSGYLVKTTVSQLTFHIATDEDRVFIDFTVTYFDGRKSYSPDENGNITIDVPPGDFCVDVYFNSLFSDNDGIITDYRQEYYTVTIDGVYAGSWEIFIPEAGQVIRAELTEAGIEAGLGLKGFVVCLWDEDGNDRYIRAENGAAVYTVNEYDAACGFDVSLITNFEPFAGEYTVSFYDGNGEQVWAQNDKETLLASGEIYSIPDPGPHPFESEDDIDFFTLVAKAEDIYAVRFSSYNFSYTWFRDTLEKCHDEEAGTWSFSLSADVSVDGDTYSQFGNFVTIWWTEEEYLFDNPDPDSENGEFLLYYYRVDAGSGLLTPEIRFTNLEAVGGTHWKNEMGNQVVRMIDETKPAYVSFRFPAGLTPTVFLGDNLALDYGAAADEDGWVTVPVEEDAEYILTAYPGEAAVVIDNVFDIGYCGTIDTYYIAPIPEEGMYYAMLFYGVNKEGFKDTITTSLYDVNDFTEARFEVPYNDGCIYSCTFYDGGLVPETEYYAKVVLFYAGDDGNRLVASSEPFTFTTQPAELDSLTLDVPFEQMNDFNCYTFTPAESGWYEFTAGNASYAVAKDRYEALDCYLKETGNIETEQHDITILFYAEKDTVCYLYAQRDENDSSSRILLTKRAIETKTDEATGITAEADEGLTLVVDEIGTPEAGTEADIYEAAEDLLENENSDFMLFNITLVDSKSNEQQPDGAIIINIPIPKDYDADFCFVYHISDNGSAEEIQGEILVKDGTTYFTFVTTHLSYYALVCQHGYEVGDVNSDGAIDLMDVSLLFRWWNGKDVEISEALADVNGDKTVDLRDAAALFRVCAG